MASVADQADHLAQQTRKSSFVNLQRHKVALRGAAKTSDTCSKSPTQGCAIKESKKELGRILKDVNNIPIKKREQSRWRTNCPTQLKIHPLKPLAHGTKSTTFLEVP